MSTEDDTRVQEALRVESKKALTAYLSEDEVRAAEIARRLSGTSVDGEGRLSLTDGVEPKDIKEALVDLSKVCKDSGYEVPKEPVEFIRTTLGVYREVVQEIEEDNGVAGLDALLAGAAPIETESAGIWYPGLEKDLGGATRAVFQYEDKEKTRKRPRADVEADYAKRDEARAKLRDAGVDVSVLSGRRDGDPVYRSNELRVADATRLVFGGRPRNGSTMTIEEARDIIGKELKIDYTKFGPRATEPVVPVEAPEPVIVRVEGWGDLLNDKTESKRMRSLLGGYFGEGDFQEVAGGLSKVDAAKILVRVLRVTGVTDAEMARQLGLGDISELDSIDPRRLDSVNLEGMMQAARAQYFTELVGGSKSKTVALRLKIEMAGDDIPDSARKQLVSRNMDSILGELVKASEVGGLGDRSPESLLALKNLKEWAMCKDFAEKAEEEVGGIVEDGPNREKYSENDWRVLRWVHGQMGDRYQSRGSMQSFSFAGAPGSERFNPVLERIKTVENPELRRQLTDELVAVSWIHDMTIRFSDLPSFSEAATATYAELGHHLETLMHMENEHGFMVAKSMVEYDRRAIATWGDTSSVCASELTSQVLSLEGNQSNRLYQQIALDAYRMTGAEARFAFSKLPNAKGKVFRGGDIVEEERRTYKKNEGITGGSKIIADLIHMRKLVVGKFPQVLYRHLDSGMGSFWDKMAADEDTDQNRFSYVSDGVDTFILDDTRSELDFYAGIVRSSRDYRDGLGRSYFKRRPVKFVVLNEELLLNYRETGSLRSVEDGYSYRGVEYMKDWLTDLAWTQTTKLEEVIKLIPDLNKGVGRITDRLISDWGPKFYVQRAGGKNQRDNLAEARIGDFMDWFASGPNASKRSLVEVVVKFTSGGLLSPAGAARILNSYPLILTNVNEILKLLGSATGAVGEITRELTSKG